MEYTFERTATTITPRTNVREFLVFFFRSVQCKIFYSDIGTRVVSRLLCRDNGCKMLTVNIIHNTFGPGKAYLSAVRIDMVYGNGSRNGSWFIDHLLGQLVGARVLTNRVYVQSTSSYLLPVALVLHTFGVDVINRVGDLFKWHVLYACSGVSRIIQMAVVYGEGLGYRY